MTERSSAPSSLRGDALREAAVEVRQAANALADLEAKVPALHRQLDEAASKIEGVLGSEPKEARKG